MKYLFAITLAFLIACTPYQQKLNVVDATPEGKVAPPQECPNWEGAGEGDMLNNNYSNLGCATVTNYGAMVKTPSDLIVGRGTDADSQRSSLFVKAYNAGSPADVPVITSTSSEGAK